MPLSPDLAQWLRAEGHDAVHASELSMSRSPDSEILQAALSDGRVVVTADLDFPRLLAGRGSSSPGLILLRGGNYSEAESKDCVRRVLMSVAHAELPESVSWLTSRVSADAGFPSEDERRNLGGRPGRHGEFVRSLLHHQTRRIRHWAGAQPPDRRSPRRRACVRKPRRHKRVRGAAKTAGIGAVAHAVERAESGFHSTLFSAFCGLSCNVNSAKPERLTKTDRLSHSSHNPSFPIIQSLSPQNP